MSNKPDLRKYPAHSTERNKPVKVERVVPVKPKKVGNMIVCDGVKIGRLEEGKILVYDKDKRRSEERGSNEVAVDPDDLKELCEDCDGEEGFVSGGELENVKGAIIGDRTHVSFYTTTKENDIE